MVYLITFVLMLLSTLAMVQMCDAFMVRKKGYLPFWLYIFLFSVFSVVYLSIVDEASFWIKQSCNIVLSFGFTLLVYKAAISHRLFVAVLFTALELLMDMAVSFLFMIAANASLGQLQLGYGTFLIGAGTTHLLLFLATTIIKKNRVAHSGGYTIQLKQWVRLLIFPLASTLMLAAFYSDTIGREDITVLMVVSVAGLIGANIALIYIVDQLEAEHKARAENHVLHQQLKAERQSLEALAEHNMERARIAHDHANHLSTIAGLLQTGQVTQAKSYVAVLSEKQAEVQGVVGTNNPVADAVINLKYSIAKKKGIRMAFEVDDLSNISLRGEQLSTVLSNVLDNAIEACNRVDKHAEIRVKLVCSQDETLISVCNTVGAPVSIVNNMVHTTKKSGGLHGFGLKNVASVLEENGFSMALGCENGWFQFTAVC